MKNSISIAIFIMIVLQVQSQTLTPELGEKLKGKTKFFDIKNEILSHYESEYNKAVFSNDENAKSKVLKQLKKWNRKFYISEFYTNEFGIVQDADKRNADEYKQWARNHKNDDKRYQPNFWISAGPNDGDKGLGRIDEIAFDPSNGNIAYAGSASGGLFKSTNGGNTWFPIGDYLPSLGVSGIAIDPNNTNIIYVLTGDGNTSDGLLVDAYLYRPTGAGVFKSYDGGLNWFACGNFPITGAHRGRELIIDPANSNNLMAATNRGIFKTSNGGDTWTIINSGNFFDIKYQPNNSNTVFATDSTAFFRSTNGGNTFTNMNIAGLPSNNRISIGVTPANSNKVVLFCGPAINAITFQGLFISTNAGLTFNTPIQTPNLFFSFIGTDVLNDQSVYDNCIAISPVNENEIFVGGLVVWRSNDNGITWTQASAYWPSDNPYMHPDIQALKYNTVNNYLYAATDGGVYRLETDGTWTFKSDGLNATQFYHFERENDEGDIWGGAQDNGILEQTSGSSFYNYSTGDGYDVMTDHDYLVFDGDSDDVYYSQNASIYKDCIAGPCNISVPNNSQFFANLMMSPVYEDRIYAGYANGLWRSLDAGSTWTTLYNQPANWCVGNSATATENVYYAGSNNNATGIFHNGTNITPPAPYNTNLKITDIDVDRQNDNILVIGVAGFTSNAKVFYSNNGGGSWTNYSFNLPNVPVFSVKLDQNGGIYAGTAIGVFYKASNLNYWQQFSNGLPPVPVSEIELWPVPFPMSGIQPDNPPATPEVWISTFGRGIWYTQQYQNTCPNTHSLTGDIKGVLLSQANLTINSAQNIYGGTGTNVEYRAGDAIILQDNFRANYGSSFKAKITTCNNN